SAKFHPWHPPAHSLDLSGAAISRSCCLRGPGATGASESPVPGESLLHFDRERSSRPPCISQAGCFGSSRLRQRLPRLPTSLLLLRRFPRAESPAALRSIPSRRGGRSIRPR